MILIFENEFGTVKFSGTGADLNWHIKEITGLGYPEKSYTYHAFPGVPGHSAKDEIIHARTVTVSVDIPKNASVTATRGAKILSHDGVLSILTKNKKRCINVRTVSFTKAERKENITQAVVQFEADNPYFFDETEKNVTVAQRGALLSSPFVLPTVFSERKTEADIVITGDTDSEPKLLIRGTGIKHTNSTNELLIRNETTNGFIKLLYLPKKDETITIDIGLRSITSDKAGDLFYALSDDTSLSGFVLARGNNHIAVKTGAESVYLFVTYRNNYGEAMYE